MNLVSHPPAEACMEAWLNCENLLIKLGQKNTIPAKTAQLLDECAQICLGTYHALNRKMIHIGELALICMGICEECADLCDQYDDVLFRNCAAACRNCSASITPLAASAA